MKLPDGVQRILFGDEFSQAIGGVKSPSKLQGLLARSMFNEWAMSPIAFALVKRMVLDGVG